MAAMIWDLYEELLETTEILADKDLMENLRSGLDDIKSGRTYSLEESLKRLGL
ncbi:MAG: hypothetical protein JXL81_13995 [Deltaproteobacteria bacterium]|nr:hypothetical protein [Deltaproteobacteria bacterium]